MDLVLSIESGRLSLIRDGHAVDGGREISSSDLETLKKLSNRYAKFCGLGEKDLSGVESRFLEIGQELYQWLDGPQSWLAESWQDLSFPLHFEIQAPYQPDQAAILLLHAPWEVLASPEQGFLAAAPDWNYAPVRRIGKPKPSARSLPPYRLGIAAMAAAPRGQQELDYEAEENAIQHAAGSGIDLVVEDSGDPHLLGERLAQIPPEQQPHVLHLSCHGHNGWGQPPRPVLMMEDEYGDESATDASALIGALNPSRPPLLFVSACLTASAAKGEQGAELSMAGALARHLPAVLGWDGRVADQAAILFAQAFYAGLAKRMTVADAAAAARQVLLNAAGTGRAHWHLARVWLGREGGGPVVGGTTRRSLLPPNHAFEQVLIRKGSDQLVVPDAALFVGRRREIQTALRHLNGENSGGVLLHGMGRLGKTSLAARLASRRPDLKLAVVYRDYAPQDILAALIDALANHEPARRLLQERRDQVRDNPQELNYALNALLSGPCAQGDGGQPVLLLIDDLERILEPDPQGGRHRVRAAERPTLRAVLQAFSATNTRSRLILTSRYPFTLIEGGREWAETLVEIPLGAFSSDTASKLERRQIAFARQKAPKIAETVWQERESVRQQAVEIARGNPGLQDLLVARLVLSPSVPLDRIEVVLADMRAWLGGADSQTEEVRKTLEEMAVSTLLELAGAGNRALLRACLLFFLPVPEAVLLQLAKNIGGDVRRLRDLGLLDSSPDWFDRETTALGLNRLIVDRLTPLSETEQSALAQQVVADLFTAWGGENAQLFRPFIANFQLTELGLWAEDGRVVESCAGVSVQIFLEFNRKNASKLGKKAIYLLEKQKIPLPLRLLSSTARALQFCGEGADATQVLGKGACRLAEIIQEDQNNDRIHYLAQLGDLQRTNGELEEAKATFEQMHALTEKLGEAEDLNKTIARGKIADILIAWGQFDEALTILREEMLPAFEQLGDMRERAVTMGRIADILMARGQLDEALKIRQEDELPIYQRLGDVHSRAMTMGQIADIRMAWDQFDEALTILQEEVLPAFKRLENVHAYAVTACRIADLFTAQKKFDMALNILKENTLPLFMGLNDIQGISNVKFRIAQITLNKHPISREDISLILNNSKESFVLFQKSGHVDGLVAAGNLFGYVLYAHGNKKEAHLVLDIAVKAAERLGWKEKVAEIRSFQEQIGR